MKLKDARQYRRKIEHSASTQTDADALQSIDLFPKWVEGKDAERDARWQYDGVLYKCVQAHRTQSDWTPDKTPTLWVKVSLAQFPDWTRPTGAHDAYNIGDKVTFEGKHYESTINANVYSPAEYPAGWKEV